MRQKELLPPVKEGDRLINRQGTWSVTDVTTGVCACVCVGSREREIILSGADVSLRKNDLEDT